MAEVNACCSIVLEQRLFGQKVVNVFYFRGSNAANPYPPLASVALAFQTDYLPSINSIQAADVVNEFLQLNLFNLGSENFFLPLTGGGTRSSATADCLPTFVGVGFTLGVETGITRPGGKRFAGVLETDSADGSIAGGAYTTTCINLAAKMDDPLTVLGESLVPVVVKRIAEGLLAPFTYRLPTNLLESNYNDITEVDLNPILTSQVSRKLGRGL